MTEKLRKIETGLRFISASINVAFLAGVLVCLSSLAFYVRAGGFTLWGILAAGALIYVYLLLSLLGKMFCFYGPVSRHFLGISIVLDIGTAFLGSTTLAPYRGLLGVVSGALFLGFFLQLGDHIESTRVTDQAMSVGKCLGAAFAFGALEAAVSFGIFGLIATCYGVVALFRYLTLLSYTREDIHDDLTSQE